MNAAERATRDFETWTYVEALRQRFEPSGKAERSPAWKRERAERDEQWDSIDGGPERDSVADKLIDVLSYQEDSELGRLTVTVAADRIERAGDIETLKTEAFQVCRATVHGLTQIRLNAAVTRMVEAYVKAETGDERQRRHDGLSAVRWAITRPAIIEVLMGSGTPWEAHTR